MASRTVAKRAVTMVLSRNQASLGGRSDLVTAFFNAKSATSLSPGTNCSNLFSRQNQQVSWFSDKSDAKAESESATEEAPKEAETVEENVVDDPEKKIQELEAKVKDLQDRMLRSLAEQDNTRRIAKRDVDEARQYAIKSFAKSILDVSDNLERALNAVPEAMQADKESHHVLATLYEGIEMTEKGLNKTFEMNGLVKYGTTGEPFDPNIHEALFEYSDPEKVPGTVGQVIKPGFTLNKRVLRPAEVGVIKKDV